MKLEIYVDGQFKKFWLAFKNGWRPFYGHEIKVGEYRFVVGGKDGGLLISELTTGAKIKHMPMNPLLLLSTVTREDTLEFYQKNIGVMLSKLVQLDAFKRQIEKLTRVVKEEYPPQPPIEVADDSIIREPISDVLN